MSGRYDSGVPVGTVGLLHPGAHGRLDREVWSGVPMQLHRALTSIGVSVAAVGMRPPRQVGRVVGGLQRVLRQDTRSMGPARDLTTEMRWAAGAAVKVRQVAGVASGSRPRHWIVMGSSFGVPLGPALTTYDDITVAQAAETGDFGLRLLSECDIGRWKKSQRHLSRRARACCVASGWAARSIVETYGIAPRKVRAVGFGGSREPQPLERDWSVPSFLFVGGDWRRKNGDRVIRAFSRLHEEQPDARLHLVGDHPSIDVAGVTGHGYLSRSVPEQHDLYEFLLRETTCFVMPSLLEPFGNAYVDAASSGLPSIGTTVGGAADAIGRGGVTVGPCDDQAIYEAMKMLTVSDVAAPMGAAALRHSHLFKWDKIARRLLHAVGMPAPDGQPAPPVLPWSRSDSTHPLLT